MLCDAELEARLKLIHHCAEEGWISILYLLECVTKVPKTFMAECQF